MEFGRLLTAMVTPMHPDGSVNHEASAQLARYLVEHGTDTLVVTGTTGESPTLTVEEKLDLYRTVREAVGDSARVVAGTGSYSTRESLELTQEAEKLGVDGAMLVVPYYNNPPQEGLYRHFRAIAEGTRLPIILYNVPSRAPRNMEAATTLRLAEIPNIVAVKEASGKLEQIAEILGKAPEGFRVYSGDDSSTLPLMSMGAYGIISVAGHLAGKQIRQMVDAFAAGNVAEAARWHQRLLPLFQACFCTTNPIPVKAGVSLLGIPAGPVRLPLVDADEQVIATVRREMEALGIL
ncbi:MAG: 4-hydroxy-tetrahydrodipicolinate synthase [Armatimonadota bacterium]